jgi:hypothetical protein
LRILNKFPIQFCLNQWRPLTLNFHAKNIVIVLCEIINHVSSTSVRIFFFKPALIIVIVPKSISELSIYLKGISQLRFALDSTLFGMISAFDKKLVFVTFLTTSDVNGVVVSDRGVRYLRIDVLFSRKLHGSFLCIE